VKKIEMLFLLSEESIYITSTVLKMINSCVSQQSIAKQILVNNLRLVPDLSNVIKEFIFYDKVSQVSQDVKKYVIGRLNLVFDGAASNSRHGPSSYVEENGMMMILEGYGEMATTGEPVRYRHIAIKCLDSVYGLQYVICYKCGNYILSESSSAPQILCNCGVVNLVDDEEEEEAAETDAEAEADASEIDILEIINWNFPYEEAQEVAAYMEYAEFQEEQEEHAEEHAEEQEEQAEEQEEQEEEQEEQEEQEEEQQELHEAEFNLEEIVINLEDEFDLEYSI